MKLLRRIPEGFTVWRIGIGVFRGRAGDGYIALFRGKTGLQLRIWRYVIAFKMRELPDVAWEFYWPRNVTVK